MNLMGLWLPWEDKTIPWYDRLYYTLLMGIMLGVVIGLPLAWMFGTL